MKRIIGAMQGKATKSQDELAGLMGKGLAHCEAGRWDEAISVFSTVIKHGENSHEAHLHRSRAYLKKNKHDAALQDANKLVELSPNYLQGYSHRGVVQCLRQAYDEGIADCTQAIHMQNEVCNASTDIYGATILAELYNNRGLMQRDSQKAKADFSQAIVLAAQSTTAYHNRGILFLDLKEFDAAYADFNHIIQLQKNNPRAYYQRGIALQRKKNHQDAIKDFNKAISLSPDFVDAYNSLGLSLYHLKDVDGALGAFEKAISINENFANAHYNRGMVLKNLKRFNEALPEFAKAVSLNFQDPPDDTQAQRKRKMRDAYNLVQEAGTLIQNTGELLIQIGTDTLQIVSIFAGWAANAAAPGAGAGVSVAVELVGAVCHVAVIINNQIELAQANKKQCKRLGDRIVIICDSVVGLDLTSNTEHYILALRKLNETFKNCQTLVERFSQRNWFTRVILAGTDNGEFQDVYIQLRDDVQLLQLGLNAQQLLNEEEARQDAEVDRADLKKNIQAIIQMNVDLKNQMQHMQLGQEDRDRIMVQQLESMRTSFASLLENKGQEISNPYAGLTVIPFHTLEIEERLGEGKLGVIYLGRLHGELVAVKEIIGLHGQEAKAQFLREAQIMSRLRSRHFALFYGICCSDEHQYLIMEYMPQGSLAQYLTNKRLNLDQRHRIVLDIVSGLHYLHTAKVYHRDLTSANVLIDAHGTAELADFGLAKVAETVAMTINKGVQASASTLKILAPERLNPRSRDNHEKGDIYSLGLLIWEIMMGKMAYAGLSESAIIQKVLAGEREELPVYMPEFYRELITRCWQAVPEQRPPVAEILRLLQAYVIPDLEALNQQGMDYEKRGNLEQAARCYQQAGFYGSMRAGTNLGLYYCQGKGGLTQDYQMARELFIQSAEEGHTRAMVNLAHMYEKGWGVNPDLKQAYYWLQKASQAGDKAAEQRLQKLQPKVGVGAAVKIFPPAPAGGRKIADVAEKPAKSPARS